jgi:hypothetical protein
MVYLDLEQNQTVKRLAREAKTSETEVIRRAIMAYGDDCATQMEADKARVRKYNKAHPEGWADDPSEWFHG